MMHKVGCWAGGLRFFRKACFVDQDENVFFYIPT